ncbi:hypothetical protein J5U22_01890 [Saccharolobus shibatae]|uniref:Uncharacterized protein n=2 Tax=Saccharolobus shibatae TaxID=2286 RepID=A0A8F5C1H7_9CREN|nr:hypothetical protein J5U22_01890 [Saccharolobus shibatae]
MSRLIGSKEALENFQFVTINGRIEFDGISRGPICFASNTPRGDP